MRKTLLIAIMLTLTMSVYINEEAMQYLQDMANVHEHARGL